MGNDLKNFFSKFNIGHAITISIVIGTCLITWGSIREQQKTYQSQSNEIKEGLKTIIITVNDLRERMAKMEGFMTWMNRKSIAQNGICDEPEIKK